MIDGLCARMFAKHLQASTFTWWVSYDWKSLEMDPYYSGPVAVDFYGRLHPKHNNGTARTRVLTSSPKEIREALLPSFEEIGRAHV